MSRADFTRSVLFMNETPATPATTAVALATEVLGEPLEKWVERRRSLGQSWDRLSRDLSKATDGKCQFSRELLRRHFGHMPREIDEEIDGRSA